MSKILYSLAIMALAFVFITIPPVQAARPVAELTANPTTICEGESVYFSGSGSYDSDGQVRYYKYEYGDGSDSDWIYGLDYSYHTYHDTGTFYAKLRVMDNEDDISDYSSSVRIRVISCEGSDNNPVITSLYITPTHPMVNDDIICSAEFSDVNHDLSHATFKWYRNSAVLWTHTKSLTGKDSAEDELPFSATEAGDVIKCEVTVYDYTGRTDKESDTVYLDFDGNRPVAMLDADDTSICVGDYVRFDASDSYDPDGYIRQYHYEFGDGTTSPWISDLDYTHHKYTQTGTFYARVKVKDDDYQESGWSSTVRITVGSGSYCDDWDDDDWESTYTPVAVLNADKTSICIGENVYFDGTASYSRDGYNVKYYSFETGDGSSTGWKSDACYNHVYNTKGTYTAKLRVKDSQGKISDYKTVTINVRDDGSCAPSACGVQITNFDYLASGKTGNDVWAKGSVKNTGENSESITVYMYVDDILEDQYTMTLTPNSIEMKKFYFRVTEAGNKKVRISAYADCGASDEMEGMMNIQEGYTPVPAPEPDPLRVNIYPKRIDMVACEGGTAIIELNSPDRREFFLEVQGIKDEWTEYPESVIVDGSKKVYVFLNPTEPGTYNVTVTATTAGDKTFTQELYIYVAPKTDENGAGAGLLSGMFVMNMGNWLWGLLIAIMIVVILVLYVSNKRQDEEMRTQYIGGAYDQPSYEQPPYDHGNQYPAWNQNY